jgi:hypothetical protein
VQQIAHANHRLLSKFHLQAGKVNTFYRVEKSGKARETAVLVQKAVLELQLYAYRLLKNEQIQRIALEVVMSAQLKLTGLLVAGILCLPVAGLADTQTTPSRVHKVKKQQLPPAPLPSGPQGPVPQIPLDSIPSVAPQVSYQDGLLTIVAPNSTLGDILRGVRKHTAADIEIPATANERVVTRLGPAPAREVMAELLNGSRFNYILLGSPDNASLLVRVVLVAKTADTPAQPAANGVAAAPEVANADAPDADTPEEPAADDAADQGTADAEQPPAAPADQPALKSPQQMLQEIQQRQLQMQQQQGGQAAPYPGRPGAAVPPGQQPDQQP